MPQITGDLGIIGKIAVDGQSSANFHDISVDQKIEFAGLVDSSVSDDGKEIRPDTEDTAAIDIEIVDDWPESEGEGGQQDGDKIPAPVPVPQPEGLRETDDYFFGAFPQSQAWEGESDFEIEADTRADTGADREDAVHSHIPLLDITAFGWGAKKASSEVLVQPILSYQSTKESVQKPSLLLAATVSPRESGMVLAPRSHLALSGDAASKAVAMALDTQEPGNISTLSTRLQPAFVANEDSHKETAEVTAFFRQPDSPSQLTINSRTSLALPVQQPVHRQLGDAILRIHDSAAEITLSPEELGSVRLTITRELSGLIISLQAERPETLELMRRNADLLQQELSEKGSPAAELKFSLSGQGGGTSDHKGAFYDLMPRNAEESAALSDKPKPKLSALGPDRIDVRV